MNTYVAFNQPDSALYYADQILSADYMPINMGTIHLDGQSQDLHRSAKLWACYGRTH